MKLIFLSLLLSYSSINSLSAQLLVDFLPVPSAYHQEWSKQSQRVSNQSQRNRKVIYRRVCVTEHENKPLFFPSSYKDRSLTFTQLVIGSLIVNRIPTFAYRSPLINRSDLEEINPDSILLKHNLYMRHADSISLSKVAIDDVDWTKVGAYLIKEVHYLSATDSQLQFDIEAICPLRVEYIGDEVGYYPLAWIKYNDLEPFLMLLNSSIYNKNDNDIYSLNDYFRMHLYEGDIIRLGERFERTSHAATEDDHNKSLYNDSVLQLEIRNMEHRYYAPKDSLPTRNKKTKYNSPHRSVKR